ncbi:ribosome maturation factor RimP [Clostridium sp. USBA 49]|uniref:ribosome maturation factor RimP n=1 Tax=Clostridium TaxID=1485 RepID=UPI0009CF3973|nr:MULTISPECIES: ribosome maturation factor RimP [Clostridium]SKA76470.1 ribosome maturation factor RimP [Clostridium sp. USBA 49]
MNNELLMEKILKLVKPIVEEQNYELYHLEYVKEFGENYLRIYIDSPNGISLNDCEKVSRPVSDILDAADPIKESYYLEVSSPGINRILYNDAHLKKYINNLVDVKLSKIYNGKKRFEGILKNFNSNEIIISNDGIDIIIPRDKIKLISLKGDL